MYPLHSHKVDILKWSSQYFSGDFLVIFQWPSLSIFLSFSEHSRDIFHETKQGEQSNHLHFISPPGCAYYTQSSHYTRDLISMYQLTHYWKTLCLISPHSLSTHIPSLLKAAYSVCWATVLSSSQFLESSLALVLNLCFRTVCTSIDKLSLSL